MKDTAGGNSVWIVPLGALERRRRGVHVAEGNVELGPEPRRQGGGPSGSVPVDDDRRVGPLDRLRERRAVRQLVVATVEGVRLAGRCAPEAGDDLDLLLEAVEAFTERRKGDPVVLVFLLDSATAHGVDLGHRDGERTREPKVPAVNSVPRRMRSVSRASPARVIQASVGSGDELHL